MSALQVLRRGRIAMTETTVAAPDAAVTEDDTSEPKEPRVVPALKSGAKATGRGLHTAGRAVIDTDLRDMGRGLKRLVSKIPVRVHVERPKTDKS